MKKTLLFIILLSTSILSNTYGQSVLLPYKNKNLSTAQRAHDLLSRMSVKDKVCQLMAVIETKKNHFDNEFLNNRSKMDIVFKKGVNSVQPYFGSIQETVESRNRIQQYLLENTQWGIPALFVDESQHGLMKPQSTCFPQAIGLACSWDPELLKQIYTVAAAEGRSRGTHMVLSPVIDVCREPRWGRVEETYGEDPYLNGVYGTAAVEGLQGSNNGIIEPNHVAATLKHFSGHGQPEGGINQAPANYSERVLREFHFPPFKAVVKNAAPFAVMPSYNEIDGIPSHANTWLLKTILRGEFGFRGMIVSDYGAINQLYDKHFIAATPKEAAQISFNAGVQSEFPNGDYFKYLPDLVAENKIKMEDIDSAVYKVLFLKFELGLFDFPYVDVNNALKVSQSEKSKQLALEAARKSIVLLKNDRNILPLSTKKYHRIAVIGPLANQVFTGGYSGEPYYKVSLLEGIKNKVGKNAEVLFAQGCKIVENPGISHDNWSKDEVKFAGRDENLKLIKEAVKVAAKSDVIILSIGEMEQLCREAWSKKHIGDAQTLDLFGEQEDLAEALIATGKPVIVYLTNGRPLSINYLSKHASAIVEGWYMGQETGNAAADILFGDVNPSGKLTITFPKSVGQIPMYYNHKPSAQYHDYVSLDSKPLYPFGFGLSYTNFDYSPVSLSADTIAANQNVTVSVKVTNSGSMKGDEIVEMYIHDKVASVTRPVLELKDFKRISLQPGESKTVSFIIDSSKLGFYNKDMKFVTEPGEFEILVGKSSQDLQKKILTVL